MDSHLISMKFVQTTIVYTIKINRELSWTSFNNSVYLLTLKKKVHCMYRKCDSLMRWWINVIFIWLRHFDNWRTESNEFLAPPISSLPIWCSVLLNTGSFYEFHHHFYFFFVIVEQNVEKLLRYLFSLHFPLLRRLIFVELKIREKYRRVLACSHANKRMHNFCFQSANKIKTDEKIGNCSAHMKLFQ